MTKTNFDRVSDRVVRWAVVIEADGDHAALDAFVQSIFRRGVQDPSRCELYVALCVRIVDELESERNLWKRVEPYHIGNPLHSFETVLRLMPNACFRRAPPQGSSEVLFLLAFTGELLVQGVLYVEDTQDIVASLVDGAGQNNPDAAIGLRRFLAPVMKAFNAMHILTILGMTQKLEDVLHTPDLSNMVRFTTQVRTSLTPHSMIRLLMIVQDYPRPSSLPPPIRCLQL